MRKTILFLCLIFLANKTFAIDWEKVIQAIAKVESNYNPKAFNKKGNCAGYLQITPILVKQCNIILKEKRYKIKDRFDKDKSIEMFYIIQKYYNPENNIEKAIRLWNGGPRYSIKGTQKYFNKVSKEFNKIINSN